MAASPLPHIHNLCQINMVNKDLNHSLRLPYTLVIKAKDDESVSRSKESSSKKSIENFPSKRIIIRPLGGGNMNYSFGSSCPSGRKNPAFFFSLMR
jgi:hypothetical protein